MDRATVASLCLIILCCPGVYATSRKCSFPVEWRGRYYQTGLKQVDVRENFITTKGICIEQNSRDYFLFYNRESQCYQCLLIMRQHRNIIQYKESYCTNVANMTIVCNHIRVETTLYTMVKEPVVSGVKCPFQDAFNFSYNDAGSEFCSQMESYARPCVSQTRYQLLFRHCTGSAEYHDRELHLECLATWKDGSEMYLYGSLSGPRLKTKDERYRCFKYHHYGSEMSVAMSADTSCRGLRSSTDGPFLMKFSRDSLGALSSSSCRFPDWLAGVTWHSLDAKYQYTLESDAVTLLESFRSSTGHLQRTNEYRCHRHLTDARNADDVTLISHTNHKCSSRHQCIRVKRLAEKVIRFFQGPSVEIPGANEFCLSHFYDDGRLLLPADPVTSTPCPRPGIYSLATSDACHRRLEIGCHNDTAIEGQDRCHGTASPLSVVCLASWSEDWKTFVITKSKESQAISCFSFSGDATDGEWFGMDATCGGGGGGNHTTIPPSERGGGGGGWKNRFRIQNQDDCHNHERSTRSALDLDARRTQGHPIGLPTQSLLDVDSNLFRDGVQPRGRSRRPPVIAEDDDDEADDVFSGYDRKPQQRAPPKQHPVTWRRSLPPLSTPTFVFQISSSSRRVNSAKGGGAGGQPSDRGRSEGQEGRPYRGRGGDEVRVYDDDDDQSGCGRHEVTAVVVLSVIFTSVMRFI